MNNLKKLTSTPNLSSITARETTSRSESLYTQGQVVTGTKRCYNEILYGDEIEKFKNQYKRSRIEENILINRVKIKNLEKKVNSLEQKNYSYRNQRYQLIDELERLNKQRENIVHGALTELLEFESLIQKRSVEEWYFDEQVCRNMMLRLSEPANHLEKEAHLILENSNKLENRMRMMDEEVGKTKSNIDGFLNENKDLAATLAQLENPL